ncbi:hypothetical protein QT971_31745 [Microcoleus sp. herbarium19]
MKTIIFFDEYTFAARSDDNTYAETPFFTEKLPCISDAGFNTA